MAARPLRLGHASAADPALSGQALAVTLLTAEAAGGVLGGAPVAAVAARQLRLGGAAGQRGDLAAASAFAALALVVVAARTQRAVGGEGLDQADGVAAGALALWPIPTPLAHWFAVVAAHGR